MKATQYWGYRRTTTVGRLKVKDASKVRPFVAAMPKPVIGESLLGFVTRCLSETAAKRTTHGLALASIGKLQPFTLPTTLNDREDIDALATLLQADPDELTARTYRLCTLNNGRSEAIEFFGVKIRAEYREKRVRRVSPRALELSPHYRAVWDLRVFSFDPETRETLLSACPVCMKRLGWMRACGIHMCEHCVDERGLANVDLRDFPQTIVEVNDVEALNFVTGLVDPDLSRRADAQKLASPIWSKFDASDLFETAVAFACVLTMPAEKARTTLDRPKAVEEYGRFTPEVLASAGRVIMDGDKGFTAVADRLRADAAKRPGFYGMKKELMPLFCMSVDQHLRREVKDVVKSAIALDMERTSQAIALRRSDYAGDGRYQSIDGLAQQSGLPKKALGRLAASGVVEVVRAADAGLSPVMMRVSEVMPLAALYRDAIHVKFAAGALAIEPYVLDSLVSRRLVERLVGPVLALFDTKDPYFRKSSIESLASSIWERARASGPDPEKALRVSKAVKRLGMTPVPWGAVIAAISKGKAPVCVHPGENKNWLTGVAVTDVQAFVKVVRTELRPEDGAALDDWVSCGVAAEIINVNENAAWRILNKQTCVPKKHRIRRKTAKTACFARADIERFANTYIFGTEIQLRAGLRRARDVREWLGRRRVKEAFSLEGERYFGYRRAQVEPLLVDEMASVKVAGLVDDKKQPGGRASVLLRGQGVGHGDVVRKEFCEG